MSEDIDLDPQNGKELRVRLSPKMFKWLGEIMEQEGLVTLTETTRFIIRERYKRMKEELLEK